MPIAAIRAALLALGLAGLLALAWGVFSIGRDLGSSRVEARLQQAVAEAERQRAATLERALMAERQVAEHERQARAEVAAIAARLADNLDTVRRVIRENPEFAATRRPAALERLRDDELARLAAAAREAADLSDRILPGVPGPDPDAGREPGPDGSR